MPMLAVIAVFVTSKSYHFYPLRISYIYIYTQWNIIISTLPSFPMQLIPHALAYPPSNTSFSQTHSVLFLFLLTQYVQLMLIWA